MITIQQKGSFKNTDRFFNAMKRKQLFSKLESFGREGAAALAANTPVDSGETANSWSYEVRVSPGRASITWTNSHINAGANIAILIQYGHGTGTGGYVPGRDYINPVIKPLFDRIIENVWREVTSA